MIIEGEHPPLDIKMMAFGDLVTTEPLNDSRHGKTIEMSTVFQGSKFTLVCEHNFVVGDKVDTEIYAFDINREDKDCFSSGIALRSGVAGNLDATLLIRHIETDLSLKGIGAVMYNKLLDFLQKLANDRGVEITHFVQDYGEMDETKWRDFFSKLVEPRGYENCEGNPGVKNNYIWKKTYRPNKT